MKEPVWHATSQLRWLKKDGRKYDRVLQQLWYCYEGDDKEGFMMFGAKEKEEWRDIEVVEDAAQP